MPKFTSYKEKFNKKYGFEPDQSHSISEIAKLTGYKKSGLDIIYDKGMAAFFTNPSSVRPTVKSPQQWGISRIYSAVMSGKASKVDAAHLIR